MLRWSLTIFIVAIIAAVFGLTSFSAGSPDSAWIVYFFFLVFFAAPLIWGLAMGRKVSPRL